MNPASSYTELVFHFTYTGSPPTDVEKQQSDGRLMKQNSVFWREVCTRWYLGREARETPCECVVKELFVVCCLLCARRDGSSSPELPDGAAPWGVKGDRKNKDVRTEEAL